MKKIKIVQIGVGHDHALPNFRCVASMNEIFDLAGFVRVEGEEGLKPDFNQGYEHVPAITLEEAFAIPGLEGRPDRNGRSEPGSLRPYGRRERASHFYG